MRWPGEGGARNALYVTGALALDGPTVDAMIRDGDIELARVLILHELGHLVGLDHVDDMSQLMYKDMTGDVFDFGSGDLQGLALLGQGPCFPEL